MRAFCQLFERLDQTNRTNEKLAALVDYFQVAHPRDAAWAVYVLTGHRLIRRVSTKRLRQWAAEASGLPAWLVDRCYQVVGDLSETLALLLSEPERALDEPLHEVVEQRILPLEQMDEAQQKASIIKTWRSTTALQRFLFHKLISTSFRVGVSKKLVTRALAQVAGIDAGVMSHRLAGRFKPTAAQYEALLHADGVADDPARPYPFCLAYPLDVEPEELGEAADWQIEWKWDGLRCQAIHRGRTVLLWSRGEEMIGESFPELVEVARALPEGSVVDGEVLAWEDGRPLSFSWLQRRMGRKMAGPMLFADVPVVLMVYDLLEHHGQDLRATSTAERRALLEQVVEQTLADDVELPLKLSPLVEAASWDQVRQIHAESRGRGVEGMMLKRKSGVYEVGRVKGDWWKWKSDPYTIDAVLVMAQHGSGRRAGLFTDYTFGVWADDELVPVAKAYSGLTNDEIAEVDRFVRNHTTQRFDPVHAVEPKLVFELGFEGIAESKRHKSGIALRFPRMLRQRTDKQPAEADTLERVRELLEAVQ